VIARDVELLERRLQDLNERTVGELALAGVAFGLALAASQLRKDLAIPLFVGAVALTACGLVAFVRKRLLVEDAAVDRDAYGLEPVQRYAQWMARTDQRRAHAAHVRRLLGLAGEFAPARVRASRAELEQLVKELERDDRALDPACAVTLEHLLRDASIPSDEFRSRVRQVLDGFSGGRVTA